MTTVLHHVGSGFVDRIRPEFPDVEFVAVPMEGDPPASARGDVLLTIAWGSPNLAALAERGIRWVHTLGTGVDRFPVDQLPADVVLTCSRGASAVPISEYVLAVMLAFEKRLDTLFLDEPTDQWAWAELGGLRGRTVAVVGMGSIGVEVARRALAFGMQVVGLRRHPGPPPLDGVTMAPDLTAALAGAHHVVIAAPATPETRHLIDDRAFDAMTPGVHLVNIARGTLVDQDALARALDAGIVARATLDVVDPEPLPAGHWLYTHPRVRLSPHVSWSMPGALDELHDRFTANLRRWQAGEPLAGVVDRAAGY